MVRIDVGIILGSYHRYIHTYIPTYLHTCHPEAFSTRIRNVIQRYELVGDREGLILARGPSKVIISGIMQLLSGLSALKVAQWAIKRAWSDAL